MGSCLDSFVHSKFIVRDSSSLLISTENPDESSISPCGNRGFGVILRNKELAEYALKVFRDDTKNVQDIEKYTGWFKVSSEIRKKIEVRSREFEPVNFSSDVSLILAPDYSLQKFNSFVESQSRMDVEALYIKDYALNEVYPKSGRILVQYPVEGYGMKEFQGDKEMVNILHGKLIIGDSAVLVGSMNFCYSSMTKNRELSVVLYSKKAVGYFRKVFERDWDPKPKLLALMKINIGKELEIDMRNSTGDIREYMLYLDGKRIYEGTRGYVKVDAAGGNHIIKGVIVGKNGSIDEVTTIVHVETKSSNLDIRIILFSVIFAVFLYKVWKDHG